MALAVYAAPLRWVSFAVFFAVILGLDALVHWYLWARLVRDPAWSPEARVVGSVLFVLLAVLLPLGMIGVALGWLAWKQRQPAQA
jgi:hypothetical protein